MIELLLTILYTVFFIFLIRKLSFFFLPGIGSRALIAVFVLKIISGVILWAVYSLYYTDRATADIFKYFDDSQVMHEAVYSRPVDFFQMIFGINNNNTYFTETYYLKMSNWFRSHESTLYNESHSLIRFNAAVRFFSFGYYNVHTVFMCFFSLAGLTGLYRFLRRYMRRNRNALFVAVFLLPTVLFWGSGVLKEGLILAGMGLLLWSFDRFISKPFNWKILTVLVFSFILIRYTKFYVVLSLVPVMIAFWWVKMTEYKRPFLKFFVTAILIVASGFSISYLLPDMDVLSELARKQRDFIGLAHSMNSGSLIDVNTLEPNLWSLFKNSPEALYNVMFRPWFFEKGSIMLIPAGFENLAFILSVLLALAFFRRPDSRTKTFLALSIVFVLEIFILAGLTTPVIGAFVRYKLPALPFLFIIAFALTDYNRILKKFPFALHFNIVKILSFDYFFKKEKKIK